MFRFIGFLLCCLFLTSTRGQIRDTLFADEGYVLNDSTTFRSKLEYDLETVILKKLFFRCYPGRLEAGQKEQLYGILAQRNHVDTSQIMLIH